MKRQKFHSLNQKIEFKNKIEKNICNSSFKSTFQLLPSGMDLEHISSSIAQLLILYNNS